MSLNCCHCRQKLADEDFNVATDCAFCRKCGTHMKYSELVAEQIQDNFDPNNAPKYIRHTVTANEEIFSYHKVSMVVLFLIPFTCLWSGGSMTAMVSMIKTKGFSLETLFFLPFFLGTIFLIGLIIFMLFGKMELRFRGDMLGIFTGVGLIGRFRCVRMDEIISVGTACSKVQQNNQPMREIVLKLANDKSIKFGLYIKEEAQAWFCDLIRVKIKS